MRGVASKAGGGTRLPLAKKSTTPSTPTAGHTKKAQTGGTPINGTQKGVKTPTNGVQKASKATSSSVSAPSPAVLSEYTPPQRRSTAIGKSVLSLLARWEESKTALSALREAEGNRNVVDVAIQCESDSETPPPESMAWLQQENQRLIAEKEDLNRNIVTLSRLVHSQNKGDAVAHDLSLSAQVDRLEKELKEAHETHREKLDLARLESESLRQQCDTLQVENANLLQQYQDLETQSRASQLVSSARLDGEAVAAAAVLSASSSAEHMTQELFQEHERRCVAEALLSEAEAARASLELAVAARDSRLQCLQWECDRLRAHADTSQKESPTLPPAANAFDSSASSPTRRMVELESQRTSALLAVKRTATEMRTLEQELSAVRARHVADMQAAMEQQEESSRLLDATVMSFEQHLRQFQMCKPEGDADHEASVASAKAHLELIGTNQRLLSKLATALPPPALPVTDVEGDRILGDKGDRPITQSNDSTHCACSCAQTNVHLREELARMQASHREQIEELHKDMAVSSEQVAAYRVQLQSQEAAVASWAIAFKRDAEAKDAEISALLETVRRLQQVEVQVASALQLRSSYQEAVALAQAGEEARRDMVGVITNLQAEMTSQRCYLSSVLEENQAALLRLQGKEQQVHHYESHVVRLQQASTTLAATMEAQIRENEAYVNTLEQRCASLEAAVVSHQQARQTLTTKDLARQAALESLSAQFLSDLRASEKLFARLSTVASAASLAAFDAHLQSSSARASHDQKGDNANAHDHEQLLSEALRQREAELAKSNAQNLHLVEELHNHMAVISDLRLRLHDASTGDAAAMPIVYRSARNNASMNSDANRRTASGTPTSSSGNACEDVAAGNRSVSVFLEKGTQTLAGFTLSGIVKGQPERAHPTGFEVRGIGDALSPSDHEEAQRLQTLTQRQAARISQLERELAESILRSGTKGTAALPSERPASPPPASDVNRLRADVMDAHTQTAARAAELERLQEQLVHSSLTCSRAVAADTSAHADAVAAVKGGSESPDHGLHASLADSLALNTAQAAELERLRSFVLDTQALSKAQTAELARLQAALTAAQQVNSSQAVDLQRVEASFADDAQALVRVQAAELEQMETASRDSGHTSSEAGTGLVDAGTGLLARDARGGVPPNGGEGGDAQASELSRVRSVLAEVQALASAQAAELGGLRVQVASYEAGERERQQAGRVLATQAAAVDEFVAQSASREDLRALASQQALEGLQASLATARSLASQQSLELHGLRAQLSETKALCDSQAAEVVRLQADLGHAHRFAQAKAAEASQVQLSLIEAQAQAKAYSSELEQLWAQAQAQVTDPGQAAEITQLRSKLADAQALARTQAEELAQLQASVAESKSLAQSRAEELARVKTNLGRTQAKVQAQEAEVQRVQAKLEETTALARTQAVELERLRLENQSGKRAPSPAHDVDVLAGGDAEREAERLREGLEEQRSLCAARAEELQAVKLQAQAQEGAHAAYLARLRASLCESQALAQAQAVDVECLQRTLSDTQAALAARTAELDTLRAGTAESVGTAQAVATDGRGAVKHLEETVAQLTAQLEQKRAELAGLEKHQAAVVEGLERRIAELTSELAGLEQHQAAVVEGLEGRIAELTSELARRAAGMERSAERVAALTAEVERQTAAAEGLEERIADLTAELEHRQQAEPSSEDGSSLPQSASELAAKASRIEQLETALDAASAERDMLQADLSAKLQILDSQLRDRTQHCEALEHQLEQAQAEASTAAAALESAQQTAEEQDALLRQAQAEASTAAAALESAQQAAAEQDALLRQVQARCAREERLRAGLEAEIASLRHRCTQLMDSEDDDLDEVVQLRAQLQNTTKQLDAKTELLNEVMAQASRHKSELAAAKAATAAATAASRRNAAQATATDARFDALKTDLQCRLEEAEAERTAAQTEVLQAYKRVGFLESQFASLEHAYNVLASVAQPDCGTSVVAFGDSPA